MGVSLTKIPAVLKSIAMHKPEGSVGTLKKLVLEVDLSDGEIVEALSGGDRPLFRGLDLLEQGAADGGGPYKIEICRRIGDVHVELRSKSGVGHIVTIEQARFVGTWKIHISANAETMKSRITVIGAVDGSKLAGLDTFCGADITMDLRTLATAEEEEQAAKGRATKAKNAAPLKVVIVPDAEVDDDDDGGGSNGDSEPAAMAAAPG